MLLNNKDKEKVSNLFKAISDPTRIDILTLLNEEELTVSEIVNKLKMSQSAISHQLKTLRDASLVKASRSGKFVYYSLKDKHVYEIFNQAIEHVLETDCEVSNGK